MKTLEEFNWIHNYSEKEKSELEEQEKKEKEERELEEISENIRRLRIIKRDLEKAGR